MLTRSHIALGMQEFMNIQSKVAPDQCELPRLSARIQELAKYVQAPSPDYQVLMQQNIDLRAKCKY